MDMKEILEDLKSDLDTAKSEISIAKELVSLGKEVGLSVVKFNADIRRIEGEAKKYEKALERRLNGVKAKK